MLKYLTTRSLCAGPHLVTPKTTSQCLSVSRSVSLSLSHGPSTCTDSVITNNHYWIMHFLQRLMCEGKLRSTCTQEKVTHSTNVSYMTSKLIFSFLAVPTGIKGTKDYHVTGRVSCSFGQFGTSLGMYVNQTTMLCLSPHIPGRANQYSRHLTKVAVAWNGEDFLEDTSQATVTFVGTGSNY